MSVNTDRAGFGTIFVLALYGVVSSSLMPMGRLQEPGPGFFPLALSVILLVLAGLGIVSARLSAQAAVSRTGQATRCPVSPEISAARNTVA